MARGVVAGGAQFGNDTHALGLDAEGDGRRCAASMAIVGQELEALAHPKGAGQHGETYLFRAE